MSAVSHGAFYGDNWSAGRGVGLTDDNALAITQSGRFMLRVENAMLVVYEWSGSGMSMTWQRRCQLAAPEGYTFRTSECRSRMGVARGVQWIQLLPGGGGSAALC